MRSAGPNPPFNLDRDFFIRIRKIEPPPPRRRKSVFSDRLLSGEFIEKATGEEFKVRGFAGHYSILPSPFTLPINLFT